MLMSLLAAITMVIALWTPTAAAAPEALPSSGALPDATSFVDTSMTDRPVVLAQQDDRRYGRGFDTPIGALSVLRVGASAFAAVAVFVLLSLPLSRAGRDPAGEHQDDIPTRSPLLPNLGARVAASAAVFVVALLVLAA